MKHKLFIAAFLLLCLVPSLGLMAFGPAKAAANERQAALPALRQADGRWNLQYLTQLGDWFGDRFALRQELVTAHSALTAAVMHTSAAPEVLLGRDGWLFYADTLDDYTGAARMTERELWSAARSLGLMAEYCRGLGAEIVFTVAPNKNALYGDRMPARYPAAADPGDGERLLALLREEGVVCADLFSAFRAQPEPLYRKQDSHWTQQGAALAADTLLAALGREGDWFRRDYTEAYDAVGDLYEMLYPAGTARDRDLVYAGDFTFTYPRPVRSPEELLIRTACPGRDGSLLMFRDSFGNALYPLLAEEFGSACFSRLTPYDLSMVTREGADTVVVELVQRNLRWLLDRPARFPAPQRGLPQETDQLPVSGTAAVTTVPSDAFPAYLEASGSVSCPGLDTASPVYLLCGERLYEATPTGERGFLACLPEGEAGQIRAVLVYCGGSLTRLEIKPEE